MFVSDISGHLVELAAVGREAMAQLFPMVPEGATYPRAEVHGTWGSWYVVMTPSRGTSHLLREVNLPGDPLMTFDSRAAAMTHAAREVHALRSRKHPAGQSWLRSAPPAPAPVDRCPWCKAPLNPHNGECRCK